MPRTVSTVIDLAYPRGNNRFMNSVLIFCYSVHDCFNWLCVAIFLPLEYAAHPLERLSSLIVSNIKSDSEEEGGKLDFLKVITKPFTKKIINVNKTLISEIAKVSITLSYAKTSFTA